MQLLHLNIVYIYIFSVTEFLRGQSLINKNAF